MPPSKSTVPPPAIRSAIRAYALVGLIPIPPRLSSVRRDRATARATHSRPASAGLPNRQYHRLAWRTREEHLSQMSRGRWRRSYPFAELIQPWRFARFREAVSLAL